VTNASNIIFPDKDNGVWVDDPNDADLVIHFSQAAMRVQPLQLNRVACGDSLKRTEPTGAMARQQQITWFA